MNRRQNGLPEPDGSMERAQRNLRWFHHISLGVWILALVTMILGPYVRAENAGLSCPDWPLCFGHVVPPYEYRVYLEFIHRVFAGVLLGPLFVIWLVFSWLDRNLRSRFGIWTLLAALVLGVQIFLGRQTVTMLLNPYIVKSHLLNALVLLGIMLLVWRRARVWMNTGALNVGAVTAPVLLQRLLVVALLVQIYLGGRVSANEAGLACTSFPACYTTEDASTGQSDAVYFPPMTGHTEMHITHRLGGYALFLYVIFLALIGRGSFRFRRNAIFLGLLTLQILLGALNVIYSLPVPVTVLHSAMAMALFILAVITTIDTRTGYGDYR
ncbi:MAG: hypothetical protein CMN77_18670, partial [Spirochaetaceae bacterium]|nr:hypothetical protein [Spirochaetaceae bacterium]